KPVGGDWDRFPVDAARIARARRRSIKFDDERQIAAFARHRSLNVVVEKPSVFDADVLHAHAEDGVSDFSSLTAGRQSQKGHIRRAIFLDAKMHARLHEQQIVQGNFASPERIDAKADASLFCSEQWLRARWFVAMHDQSFDGDTEREPADRDRANLDVPTGDALDALDREAPNQRIARAASKKSDDR